MTMLLSADKLNNMAASGRSPDATSAPASTSMLQQLTATLREALVQQVSILVVVSSVEDVQ
ncbi:hypothetical protein H257_05712 [Aphanomyces astaci]|uniref:Uncharacterized protein n=1 Tax=Aphanomyces astaci TaxID=112090 RepID=W4GQ38_APHAT|nr:hypothetical protein H257_05712 [Aphanomyces astaci]ETV81109.1 hypothetical protein H257_05712 [Aphanomyces astaci]|eukprot:XP_009828967.1 hypothetical protein H257_05712 [Aphanomyces astaci]